MSCAIYRRTFSFVLWFISTLVGNIPSCPEQLCFQVPRCGFCTVCVFGILTKPWFKNGSIDKNITFISPKSSMGFRGNCEGKWLQVSLEEQTWIALSNRRTGRNTSNCAIVLLLGPILHGYCHGFSEWSTGKTQWRWFAAITLGKKLPMHRK